MKIYIAGKVSKDSVFGTHHWRDEFVRTLEAFSDLQLTNLDPVKSGSALDQNNWEAVFGADVYMISQCDVLVVYLSNDISIGGSQEILVAKYFNKPVIGLAPHGGKFNGSSKQYAGQLVENYHDPFVFSTCDAVCADVEGVARALKTIQDIKPKGIDLIDKAAKEFEAKYLAQNEYIRKLPKA